MPLKAVELRLDGAVGGLVSGVPVPIAVASLAVLLLQAFRLTNGLLSTSAVSRSFEIYGYPGATLAVSANGNANGILWEVYVTSMGRLTVYGLLN